MKLSSKSGIIGAVVGDALGVPYEFDPRSHIAIAPATDMIGYGTYDQPPGTWSDDSSLLLCTVLALIDGYNLRSIAINFVRWFEEGLWTPHGSIFDIGISTRNVLQRLSDGGDPRNSGEVEEHTNGNGSLMRILPIVYHLFSENDLSSRFARVAEVSAISHAHIRSKLCCFYYTEFARRLLAGDDKQAAITSTNNLFRDTIRERGIVEYETQNYTRLLSSEFFSTPVSEIYSTGYVLHTLEASVWCLLNSDNYSEAVLMAVNLGDDTDTTATVTGGLAGILYGYDAIPQRWINQVARIGEILELIDQFDAAIDK